MKTDLYASIAFALHNFGQVGDMRVGRDLDKDVRQELTRLKKIIEYCRSELSTANETKRSLLELGVGFAFVTTAIACSFSENEIEIHATEHPNRDELKNEKFLDYLRSTRVNLKTADLCHFPWPYEDGSFDIVVFSETIEHIPPTVAPQMLKEISRILKVGGVVIISTPNLAAWQYRSKLLRGKAIFDEALPISWAGGTYAHIRLYTVSEIANLCKHFCLEMIRNEYIDFGLVNKSSKIKRLAYRLIYACFPKVSPEFFVVARKK